MKRSANTTSAIREIRKKRPAFTLVELIVVITIVAVLATVGFLALSGYTKDAKDSTMKTNVRTVTQAVGLEAVTTDQSMRRFATFSGAYAMSGKVLGTVLSGGTLGTVGTNYTPGPVDFAALRMDASKLTADGTKYVMSAVDVPETLATGKTRTRSFFQVGAIDGTKTYVEGTLSPSSVTGSETDVSGIIADPTAGSNTALASNVDSGPTVAVTCNPGENGSTGVCKDPYWANVISLLHFDGSIMDERPSNAWAMNGGVAFTGVAKWGTNSVALDGVDDYVDVATSANWDF
jgi:prepilin-type N-terminal cleavage/methylation domain-containing protein